MKFVTKTIKTEKVIADCVNLDAKTIREYPLPVGSITGKITKEKIDAILPANLASYAYHTETVNTFLAIEYTSYLANCERFETAEKFRSERKPAEYMTRTISATLYEASYVDVATSTIKTEVVTVDGKPTAEKMNAVLGAGKMCFNFKEIKVETFTALKLEKAIQIGTIYSSVEDFKARNKFADIEAGE